MPRVLDGGDDARWLCAGAGTLLFINGETDQAEIYAVDETSGAVLATLAASYGVGHVVGGAYHPGRDTWFLVQDKVPGGASANRVAEVDSDTGGLINDFQVSPTFVLNFGDIDVCTTTGNLLLVSSDETTMAEFTPDGVFVAYHSLPASATSISAIALIEGSEQAWVGSPTTGQIYRVGGVPCPVPEPDALAMLAAGGALLAGLARRRRARTGAPTG